MKINIISQITYHQRGSPFKSGAETLLTLAKNEGKEITYTELHSGKTPEETLQALAIHTCHCEEQSDIQPNSSFLIPNSSFKGNSSFLIPNSPIPMTDHQTLSDIRKRQETIDQIITQAPNQNHDQLLKEKHQLNEYLFETLTNTGKIRNFQDNYFTLRKNILRNIRNFLKDLKTTDQELAELLKSSLKKGKHAISLSIPTHETGTTTTQPAPHSSFPRPP
jgi:hypothetical protein